LTGSDLFGHIQHAFGVADAVQSSGLSMAGPWRPVVKLQIADDHPAQEIAEEL
jgi:hypothetical protein